jgi:hypothetical protein
MAAGVSGRPGADAGLLGELDRMTVRIRDQAKQPAHRGVAISLLGSIAGPDYQRRV